MYSIAAWPGWLRLAMKSRKFFCSGRLQLQKAVFFNRWPFKLRLHLLGIDASVSARCVRADRIGSSRRIS